VFAPGKPFQPSPMFASEAREPAKKKGFSGAPLLSNLLALPTNIRLGWKGLPGLTL
jgi:hypothetical protein